MADDLLSPDGNFIWSGTKWIPTTKLETNSQSVWARETSQELKPELVSSPHLVSLKSQVRNLALVMIDHLQSGDMQAAKDCWNSSKMLDLSLTKQVFEKEYSVEISNAYLQIAEYKLNEFEDLYNRAHTAGIGFKLEVEVAPTMIKLALENSTAFFPGLLSFKYNLLYAKMWMFCKRFELIWVRDVCNQYYALYYNFAHDLALQNTQIFELNSLSDMNDNLQKNFAEEHLVSYMETFVGIILAMFFVFVVIVYSV